MAQAPPTFQEQDEQDQEDYAGYYGRGTPEAPPTSDGGHEDLDSDISPDGSPLHQPSPMPEGLPFPQSYLDALKAQGLSIAMDATKFYDMGGIEEPPIIYGSHEAPPTPQFYQAGLQAPPIQGVPVGADGSMLHDFGELGIYRSHEAPPPPRLHQVAPQAPPTQAMNIPPSNRPPPMIYRIPEAPPTRQFYEARPKISPKEALKRLDAGELEDLNLDAALTARQVRIWLRDVRREIGNCPKKSEFCNEVVGCKVTNLDYNFAKRWSVFDTAQKRRFRRLHNWMFNLSEEERLQVLVMDLRGLEGFEIKDEYGR